MKVVNRFKPFKNLKNFMGALAFFFFFFYSHKSSFGATNPHSANAVLCEVCSSQILHNVLQLQEVGDFGAEMFIEPQNLMRCTNFQATIEPPIYCSCCYMK